MGRARRYAGAVPAMLVMLAWPAIAGAETTKTFRVSAEVTSGCIVATDGSGVLGRIDFGTVDGAGPGTVEAAMVSATGAGLTIECTPGIDAILTADAGEHAVAGTRMLARGGEAGAIPYRLYADGAATAWTTEPIALRFAEGASRRSIPVAARAQVPGPVAAGTYTDTVRLTISW